MVLTSAAIETVTSQTQFILPASDAAPDDGAYETETVVFIDSSNSNQKSMRLAIAYKASTRTVEVQKAPDFTIVAGDTMTIITESYVGGNLDRSLKGSTHNIPTSHGRRIREITDATILREGSFQAGSTTTSLILDSGASSLDNFYRFQNLIIVDGVAAIQVRVISSYNGTDKKASISEPLVTAPPVSGDTFQVTTMGPVHAASQGGGYPDGKVFINILNGTSGDVPFFNGIITRPVNNVSDARSIANRLGFTKYEVASGSVIVLDQEFERTQWTGAGYVIVFNGQAVGGIRINNAFVTGTHTGTVLKLLRDCNASGISGDNLSLISTAIVGAITAAGGGALASSNCFSNTDAVIDFASSADQPINVLHHSGPIIVKNMGQNGVDSFNFSGMSQEITFDSSCVGGSANIVGIYKITNNGSGITFTENASIPALETIGQNTLDLLEGDHIETSLKSIINKKGTSTEILNKVIGGSLLNPQVTIITNEP